MNKNTLKVKYPYLFKKYLKLLDLKNNLYTKYYSFLGEDKYKDELAKIYKKRTGEHLDWNNLRTYNEKMQWAKLFDKNPLKITLSDKYLVRNWVKDTIGEEYLIPLLGVWNKFDEIEFEKLPERFVLKTNNGSSTNLIIKDKNNFNKIAAKRKFDKWMRTNFAFKNGFQMHYKDIKPKIIAEEYLEDQNGELNDYKFLCFDGKVHYCWIDTDRYTYHRRNIYDLNWELQDWNQHSYKNTEYPVSKPENFESMVGLAGKLCRGFSHVRVDLYNVNGKVYFGEMTFTNGSGFEKIHPYEYNLMLGKLWKLPMDSSI